ncbi:uncharacterized protein [Physcomitrium patens]|uniref:Uncharacterized protein n=1 Tax=Physcomitrium patens TaxID=3218 RepID=A0A2K1JKC5_PHYPA|nr:uncharacterized protein LOC112290296 [Physcomitrium patens]PNR42005.1 hypothetical protein PHYPA_016834 [Physcomitrium patens]|eukprot:XP_024392200.1 uncharacterized protein LOC112290296 [Physcomitrella patens]
MESPPRYPLPLPPSKRHTVPGAKIAKEGPIPGYTGVIPALKTHVLGHGFSDSSRRAAAFTDSLRRKKPEDAYHLTTENKVEGRDFFYAQLAHVGEVNDPAPVKWLASKRETPEELKYISGQLDYRTVRVKTGTTEKYCQPAPLSMSMTVLPYTNVKIQTKKTFEAFQDDTLEVMEARHHLKGYTGHVHAQQHLFSQTFGKTTRRLRGYPPDPQTSKDFIDYAENRPLCVNEFELKHPMKFHHNQLLKTGEGSLGPLPDGAR